MCVPIKFWEFNRVRIKYVNGWAQNFYDNQETVDTFKWLHDTSYK